MEITQDQLDKLDIDELKELVALAQRVKREKSTSPIRLRGYVSSVGKHVRSILEAVKKLTEAHGDEEELGKMWMVVENELRRIQLESFRNEAVAITVRERVYKGGRPPGKANVGGVEVTSEDASPEVQAELEEIATVRATGRRGK